LAEDEDSTRTLFLHEDDCALWKNSGMFDQVESCERLWGEGAEEIVGVQIATETALNAGEAVGRVHYCSTPDT
jgi:hypothetical protein